MSMKPQERYRPRASASLDAPHKLSVQMIAPLGEGVCWSDPHKTALNFALKAGRFRRPVST